MHIVVESNEKLFWKLIKGQCSLSQMATYLVNDTLLTDRGKSHQMWVDHFESLRTPSVNDNFDNDFCANVVNHVSEAFDFCMNDPSGDLLSRLCMKKLHLSVYLWKQEFLVSKLITSTFILLVHPYGNSCSSYIKISLWIIRLVSPCWWVSFCLSLKGREPRKQTIKIIIAVLLCSPPFVKFMRWLKGRGPKQTIKIIIAVLLYSPPFVKFMRWCSSQDWKNTQLRKAYFLTCSLVLRKGLDVMKHRLLS